MSGGRKTERTGWEREDDFDRGLPVGLDGLYPLSGGGAVRVGEGFLSVCALTDAATHVTLIPIRIPTIESQITISWHRSGI